MLKLNAPDFVEMSKPNARKAVEEGNVLHCQPQNG